MAEAIIIPDDIIVNKIYLIRAHKVMLDRDLASLYGVETKALKQAVKRNLNRFPEDFMFELTQEELSNLRSQVVTSNWGGSRYLPYAFTEQGLTMLSCILNSPKAIEMNIRVIRIFTKIREALIAHKDVLLKLDQLEKQVSQNSVDIQTIFHALKELLTQPQVPRIMIGYKRSDQS